MTKPQLACQAASTAKTQIKKDDKQTSVKLLIAKHNVTKHRQ